MHHCLVTFEKKQQKQHMVDVLDVAEVTKRTMDGTTQLSAEDLMGWSKARELASQEGQTLSYGAKLNRCRVFLKHSVSLKSCA